MLYFIAIGLGYIMVEIAFIQRFVLFLGYPTYALTVVVFLMLLSSGAGSLLSRRWFSEPTRVLMALAIHRSRFVDLCFRVAALAGSPDWAGFRGEAADQRALLVPLGFAMGMPFPSGLRAMSSREGSEDHAGHGAVEWAWAMNAASSVLGSVLAIVIAIHLD